MKLNHKARWLIILALVALLAVGGTGTVLAVGNRHLPRLGHIAPGHLVSGLWRTWRGHDSFGPQNTLIDWAAIKTAAANALGIGPDELQAAGQSGRDSVQALLDAAGLELSDLRSIVNAEVESQLAAAVAAGTLTQDEMDAILERGHSSKGIRTDRWSHFGEQMQLAGAIDPQAVLQTAAVELGLDEEELLAALTEGQSAVEAFLEANDTTLSEFKAALNTVWQQAIADAVEAGTLTEEQADRLNRKGAFGHGLGRGKHHGRHGHGWSGSFSNPGPVKDNA